ncbi:MAG: peroxiredoxin [Ignavibacteriales bacterium]
MSRVFYMFSILGGLLFSVFGGNAQDLKEGQKAPDFTLPDAYGKTYTLSSYQGKSPVIVYFYPKAGTPGCTKEACGIRDNLSKFREKHIPVLGVSVDSKEKIKEFIDEYKLNFPLLSDENKATAKAYGVLNKLGMANRITFIVDKNGKISNIIRNVDVNTHSEEVYKLASKLL